MAGKVGYTVSEAAVASGVTRHTIESAINARQLTAHRVAGAPVILGTDMHDWIEAQPNWLD